MHACDLNPRRQVDHFLSAIFMPIDVDFYQNDHRHCCVPGFSKYMYDQMKKCWLAKLSLSVLVYLYMYMHAWMCSTCVDLLSMQWTLPSEENECVLAIYDDGYYYCTFCIFIDVVQCITTNRKLCISRNRKNVLLWSLVRELFFL